MKEKYVDFIENYDNIVRYLSEVYGISEEVIDYATSVYGINEKTFNNIIYYYTGYHDIWQLVECDDTKELYKDYDLELFEEEEEEN